MAKDYDNTNSGALFKNEEKQKDAHPDYRGSINVGGTEYWLSGWVKKSKKGSTYMSLSVQPKEQKGRGDANRRKSADDSIPF